MLRLLRPGGDRSHLRFRMHGPAGLHCRRHYVIEILNPDTLERCAEGRWGSCDYHLTREERHAPLLDND